jgi:hypothetical protein
MALEKAGLIAIDRKHLIPRPEWSPRPEIAEAQL